MGKHRGRVRVFIWRLYWMPEGKALKVRVRVPKRYRYNKRMRRAFSDGVGKGVAAALMALEIKPREAHTEVKDD